MKEATKAQEPTVDRKFSDRDRIWASSPDVLKTRHELYLGDARDMKELADRSVHLVVTSPPYWTLKQYDGAAGEKQLGHHENYEGFHEELASVWQRGYRNLDPADDFALSLEMFACHAGKVDGTLLCRFTRTSLVGVVGRASIT